MITVTKQKPLEEVVQSLGDCRKVYIIGCGTCATTLHTGGKTEVLAMKKSLEDDGREVTGWMVIPTACDELTKEALAENAGDIESSDCILVMSCAFGVQTVRLHCDKAIYPALNTLFVGKEESPGCYADICMQCGNCVIARTAGICPLVKCAKELFNGPCGGSVGGKCEIDPNTPCAWQLIYDRLAAMGQLDRLEEIEPVKDWSTSRSGGSRKITIES
ncbi:MAG: methylenetetrahydrofolate reductase C-terminal domain-containing protein [Chloroflexota bacterium]